MKPACRARDRIGPIIKILRKEYKDAATALRYKNAFELLVSTILSAQCTDERVNRITPGLFRKYNGPRGFAAARQDELERDIYSAGFYRNKAKNIIAASRVITERFGGRVPDNMQELITLPGVARKTANIILSSAYKKAEGIAVDTHVIRVSGRLGLTKHTDPVKIEKDLMALVLKKDWLDFNYLLVNHGRQTCIARRPKCRECPIRSLCRYFFSLAALSLLTTLQHS